MADTPSPLTAHLEQTRRQADAQHEREARLARIAERAAAALPSGEIPRTKATKGRPHTMSAHAVERWADGLLAWAQAVKAAGWEQDIQHVTQWTPLRAHLRCILQATFAGDRKQMVALLQDTLRADLRQVRSVLKNLLAEFGREHRPVPQPLTPTVIRKLEAIRRRFDEAAQRYPTLDQINWECTDPITNSTFPDEYTCSYDGTSTTHWTADWNALACESMELLFGRKALPANSLENVAHAPDVSFLMWALAQVKGFKVPLGDGKVRLNGNLFHIAALAIDMYLADIGNPAASPTTQEAARDGDTGAKDDPNSRQTPRWDSERRELWLGTKLLKRFDKHPSFNQVAILEMFQVANWPSCSEYPQKLGSPDAKRAYQRLTKSLMREAEREGLPRTIAFQGDGTGDLIRWDIVSL